MTNISPAPKEDRLKRYKSLSINHFSRWRFYFHWLTILIMVTPKTLIRFKPKLYGRQHIPKEGPYIIAAHHIANSDPPVISSLFQYPIAYMAKKELFETFWWAEFYRSQGTFALDRDNPDSATLKTALNVLRSPAKWALGIFPEGTRSKTGEVLPLKKGIGSMASKTKTPVLPIGLYRDDKGHYVVTIGELITDVSDAEAVQQKVYEALVHLSDPSWERKK